MNKLDKLVIVTLIIVVIAYIGFVGFMFGKLIEELNTQPCKEMDSIPINQIPSRCLQNGVN